MINTMILQLEFSWCRIEQVGKDGGNGDLKQRVVHYVRKLAEGSSNVWLVGHCDHIGIKLYIRSEVRSYWRVLRGELI